MSLAVFHIHIKNPELLLCWHFMAEPTYHMQCWFPHTYIGLLNCMAFIQYCCCMVGCQPGCKFPWYMTQDYQFHWLCVNVDKWQSKQYIPYSSSLTVRYVDQFCKLRIWSIFLVTILYIYICFRIFCNWFASSKSLDNWHCNGKW